MAMSLKLVAISEIFLPILKDSNVACRILLRKGRVALSKLRVKGPIKGSVIFYVDKGEADLGWCIGIIIGLTQLKDLFSPHLYRRWNQEDQAWESLMGGEPM